VQTYCQESFEMSVYNKYLTTSRGIGQSQAKKNAFFGGVFYFVIFGFYAYTFFWGGYLRYNKVELSGGREYTGGVIISILFSVITGSFQLAGIANHTKVITESRVAAKFAFEVLDKKPKIVADEKGLISIKRDKIGGKIEFKNVNFTYPSRKELQVLKNFSCVFEQGKTTALVGPSGSGKSTIIQLLERFYDPDSGSVELDGQDFKNLNLKSLRQNIGFVGQEPVLFNASIRENMLFAQPEATEEEIEQALKAANAWDFIKSKMGEKGIHTNVGAGGSQLSGG